MLCTQVSLHKYSLQLELCWINA